MKNCRKWMGSWVLSGALFAGQKPVSVTTSEIVTGNEWKTPSIKIANLSDQAITALRVESVCTMRSGAGRPNRVGRVDDPLLRMHPESDAAVAAKGSMEYQLGGAPAPLNEWSCTGGLIAALFSDGTTLGDPVVVDRLRRDRVLVAGELVWHIAALSEAQKRSDPVDAVLSVMDGHKLATESAVPRDAYMQRLVYQVVTDNLKHMHLAGGGSLPDSDRLTIMLSSLQQWQKRLAPAVP